LFGLVYPLSSLSYTQLKGLGVTTPVLIAVITVARRPPSFESAPLHPAPLRLLSIPTIGVKLFNQLDFFKSLSFFTSLSLSLSTRLSNIPVGVIVVPTVTTTKWLFEAT
jgi:hypothetical protein